nr:alpha/beta hydrolase [Halomarina oriensis]
MILYPGALVPTEAYVPLAGDVAREAGMAVHLVDVPLNLAILDVDAASAVVDAHPDVDRWYVGGHSLGGAMACRYADANADELAGVVLLGAYCEADVRDTDLDVLTVVGTRDSVVNRAAVERSRALVPDDARFVAVEGMNHTQVGVYSGQADTDGTIPNVEARQRVATAVADWLTEGDRTADARPVAVSPSPVAQTCRSASATRSASSSRSK